MTVSDGGIKTERHCGCLQIVIDRLRNADAIDSGFLQLQSGRHRAVAADDDEPVDAQIAQGLSRDRWMTSVATMALIARCPLSLRNVRGWSCR